jgi:hypothetical protein
MIIAPVILTISTTFSFVTNSSSKFDK